MWRVCQAANRPWPQISPDDVTDYMVMEAVALKARKEDKEADKKREREEFKKNHSKLDKYR
jgi:hypothetical protein